ncbi:MAG: class I SAM-dependent methyltransferase [Anaerolineae bacterium]
MDEKTRLVQQDFDRLAPHEGEGWTHNRHYSDYLLRQMPEPCLRACEIGCGIGELARRMATRAESLVAIDLSPAMIDRAKSLSGEYSNIQYMVGDVMEYPFEPNSFDFMVSVATLHHLDAAAVFDRLKQALAPGGVLATLDLYKEETLGDYLTSIIAIPLDRVMNFKHNGSAPHSIEARALWDEHGKHDSYLTLKEIRQVSATILPGAVVRRHLLYRYSLLWKKPSS